jgi:uncharacterized membrane protein
MPFTVSVASEWYGQLYGALLLHGNLLLIGLPMLIIWLYAIHRRKYIHGPDVLPNQSLIIITIRFIVPLVGYAIALATAPASVLASYLIIAFMTGIYTLGVFGIDVYQVINKVLLFFILKGKLCNKMSAAQQRKTNLYLDSHAYHELIIERLKGYADAIFGIVATVLILQLHAPHKPHGHISSDELNKKLGHELISNHLWPTYISFFISVIVAGIYWKSHVYLMRGMHETNRLFIFANVLFLAAVTFIPFTTDLVGKHPDLPIAAASYNLLLVVIGVLLFGVFFLSIYKGLLKKVPKKFVALGVLRISAPPIIYAIAFGIAFVK